jgi:hypothetical protein
MPEEVLGVVIQSVENSAILGVMALLKSRSITVHSIFLGRGSRSKIQISRDRSCTHHRWQPAVRLRLSKAVLTSRTPGAEVMASTKLAG